MTLPSRQVTLPDGSGKSSSLPVLPRLQLLIILNNRTQRLSARWSYITSIDKVSLICMDDAEGKLAAQVSYSTVTLALHDGGADLFISKARLLQAKISNISLGKF